MVIIKNTEKISKVVGKVKRESAHDELCFRAEKWLKNLNCKVTLNHKFKAATINGEIPDSIGWRDGVSIVVEVKTSRTDFLADAKKPFRIKPALGMGDWRFYLCPEGLISASEIPKGWGLLYSKGQKIHKVQGVPTNTQWHSKKPFTGCKISENIMLVSALRRLTIRGYLPEIYKGPVGNEYAALHQ